MIKKETLFKMAGVASMVGLCCYASAKSKGTGVTLKDAHRGTVDIDIRMMNQFVKLPPESNEFYKEARMVLTGKSTKSLAEICKKYGMKTIGGPMLGCLTDSSVSIWMQLPQPDKVTVIIKDKKTGKLKTVVSPKQNPVVKIDCNGLSADTQYTYTVKGRQGILGKGSFTTAPEPSSKKTFKIAFGSDFHKIGLHRPELMQLMQERDNRALILTGDIAVDDRINEFGLIRSDYIMRNLSPPWQKVAANLSIYTSWDDHDYYANDASANDYTKGVPFRIGPIKAGELRSLWNEQWMNPKSPNDNVYFSTKIGPVHLIMLDTRSRREPSRQKEFGSFLGDKQMAWLKDQLERSTSPFVVLTSGTMWTDYISNGKDSWGRWDKKGREAIYKMIDRKQSSRVVLLSGDRHGARGFKVPRKNAKPICELEAGTLGGVPGPTGIAKRSQHQLFGYTGDEIWAYGELEFSFKDDAPLVTFSLINEKGEEVEKHLVD